MAFNSFILKAVRCSPLGIFRPPVVSGRTQFVPFSRFSTTGSTDEDIIRTLETKMDIPQISTDEEDEKSGNESDDKTAGVRVLSAESLFKMTPNQGDSLIPDANTDGCTIPDILRSIPDEFSVREISLKREFQDEIISIDVAYIESQEQENEDEKEKEKEEEEVIGPHLRLDVRTMKGIAGGRHQFFKFDLTASSNRLALNNITARRLAHRAGVPQHCKHLEDSENFLAMRGINPSVTNFLLHYIAKKQESRCSTTSSVSQS